MQRTDTYYYNLSGMSWKLVILQVLALPMIPQIKLFGLQTMELIVETNCG